MVFCRWVVSFAVLAMFVVQQAFATEKFSNQFSSIQWEYGTGVVEDIYGLNIVLSPERWVMLCKRDRRFPNGPTRMTPASEVCVAKDISQRGANISLYVEHRELHSGLKGYWYEGVERAFLKHWQRAARDHLPFDNTVVEIRGIEGGARACSGVSLRARHVHMFARGTINGQDVSHLMHATLVFFEHKNLRFMLAVYNRGVSNEIVDDACALAAQVEPQLVV